MCLYSGSFFFFFNDTATTEIYTLSLHDALPISWPAFPFLRCNRNARASKRSPRPGNPPRQSAPGVRSEEHTSELQSQSNLVCRLLLEKKNPSRLEMLYAYSSYTMSRLAATSIPT